MDEIEILQNENEHSRSELIAKTEQIRKLQLQIGLIDSKLTNQLNEVIRENRDLKKELCDLKRTYVPMQESLNNLTAERSKWIRKLKRNGLYDKNK